MFNIGFSELLLVLLVAFLVVGPKDLPKVARWLGRAVKKSRRLLNEIKKESGWDELEKEVRDVQHDVKDAVKQGDVSAELREAKKSVQDSAEKFDKDTKSN
ncbi:MAG: Sec-independent protein translocase protein TatB [Christensenellales bacterium]|nr:Sec-independent protein translocase protein TatB [Christensenellales bacterium]